MDILDLISETGVVLKKVAVTNGGEYAGPCPGCGGRDRFRCWPADKGGRGSFWCRGCGKAGDDVQFLVEFCGLDYPAAFKRAGREQLTGYRPAFKPQASAAARVFEPRRHESPVETWQLRAAKFVDKAHAALLDQDKILAYLAGRGLDLAAVQKFKLGWFPGEHNKNCMFRSRESWGLETVIKDNGQAKKLWIPRGIVIPWYRDEQIQRIRIRRPKKDLQRDHDIKYYIVPGSSMECMMLHSNARAFVLVEAELDAMAVVRQAGLVTGAVALGSASNKPGTDVYWVLQGAVRNLVAVDNDAAGAKAWPWWRDNFDNAKLWPVPVGKDPGDAFKAGVDLLAWIKEGLPPALTLFLGSSKKKQPAPGPVQSPESVHTMPAASVNESSPARPAIVQDTAGDKAVACPGQGPAPSSVPDLSPGVAAFKRLLEKYPFKILCTDARTAVFCPEAWEGSKIKQEICNIVFFDPEVARYLEGHPADMVHRGNFFYPGFMDGQGGLPQTEDALAG